jgi:hypothetical protein
MLCSDLRDEFSMQYPHRQALLTRAGASLLLMMCALAHAVPAEDAATGPDSIDTPHTSNAIWLSQNVPFKFRGDKVAYTCQSFKEKVRAVLLAVGVHESLIVELRCDSAVPVMQTTGRRPSPTLIKGEVENTPTGPTHISGTSARIATRIALVAPTVANEKTIREATTFDAQEHLLATMRKEVLPTPSTIPIFPAVWTAIQVNGKNNPWLEPDDCELLRQLSQQVLPAIGIKVTRKVICSGAKISKPSLNVVALVPLHNLPATAP